MIKWLAVVAVVAVTLPLTLLILVTADPAASQASPGLTPVGPVSWR